jgi:HSP20 family molecular chaperone IbpA
MKDLQKQQTQALRRNENEKDTLLPQTDIWETPEEIILKIDMPGVSKENLAIKVEGDMLKIHGKVESMLPGNTLYAEQRAGDFHREFSLSNDLNQDKINAAMAAGVLTVKIAKSEKVKPRKIQIEAA